MHTLSKGSASPHRRSLLSRLALTTKFFGPLGWTAFGGPSANIVLIRKIFVTKQEWIDDQTFNDLLALGNALPGPAFSQLAFAISCLHDGTLCGLWSFILLTAPCAIIMTGVAFAVRRIPSTLPDIVFALFTGLNAATVGLVALAAYQLSKKVVTDKTTRLLLFFSGAIASCYESQWLYPVLMVAGGATTLVVDRFLLLRAKRTLKRSTNSDAGPAENPRVEEIEMQLPRPAAPVATKSSSSGIDSIQPAEVSTTTSRRGFPSKDSGSIERYPTPPLEEQQRRGITEETQEPIVEPEEEVYFKLTIKQGLYIAAAFFVILITMLAVRGGLSKTFRELEFFTNLLLAGTIIFGGGPVVIPLLRGYVVDPGYVSPRDFLLGFAIQQACPGPVFCFTAYLGVLVLSSSTASSIGGAILAVTAIFLPGIMLKLAFLPLYQRWKTATLVRSILRGFNAGAVGLIYSAVYRLFRVGFIQAAPISTSDGATFSSLDQDGFWVSIVAATFIAVEWFKVPTPFAILGGAVAGMAWYGAVRA
ncbi:uncharacterized protein JCM6883_007430 [Sporobolomyces salmoneus]|uniref:uncharacterized protein n=1 Tax=Sporobolomyces salmoneus TaxID=183962 RepID=UPI00317F6F40